MAPKRHSVGGPPLNSKGKAARDGEGERGEAQEIAFLGGALAGLDDTRRSRPLELFPSELLDPLLAKPPSLRAPVLPAAFGESGFAKPLAIVISVP